MHAMGIHSALAIKRQRKRRDDQKRAKERRYSIQSTESGDTHSPHGSTRRKHRHHHGHHNNVDNTKVSKKQYLDILKKKIFRIDTFRSYENSVHFCCVMRIIVYIILIQNQQVVNKKY
jgi:hypothetical protein